MKDHKKKGSGLFTPEVEKKLDQRRAEALKLNWMGLRAESFKTLTFGELKRGDRFIDLPWPGNNSGHGGFRRTHWIYVKSSRYTSTRQKDGSQMKYESFLEVIRIE